MDILHATAVGRATEDPKFRTSENGSPMVTFSIAVNLSKELTNFISVSCFGTLAAAMGDKIRKGCGVTAVGRLKMVTSSKNNKSYLQLVADEINVVPPKSQSDEAPAMVDETSEEEYL